MHRQPIRVKAGELSATLVNGQLADVTLAGHIAIDSIYPTVRDNQWRTIQPALLAMETTLDNPTGSTRSAYWECIYTLDAGRFIWRCSMETTETEIRLSYRGEALAGPLLVNRIGVCILHPLELTGKTLKTANQSHTFTTSFPHRITTSPLASRFQAMRYEAGPDYDIVIDTRGPQFETEDHRNWSDPGWKSYCPPLGNEPLALPVGYETETLITITSRPRASGARSPRLPITATDIEITTEVAGTLPRIGIATSPAVTRHQLTTASEAGLGHLYAEPDKDLPAEIELAARQGCAADLDVHLALELDGQTDPDAIARQISRNPNITRVILHSGIGADTAAASLSGFASDLKNRLLGRGSACRVGAGTVSHFLHLNRLGQIDSEIDFVNFGMTPQTHHRDDKLVMQTVRVHRLMAEQAARDTGLPVHVSPVTLTRRDDPHHDPRKHGTFLASWLVGSVAALAGADVRYATYLSIDGVDGLIAADANKVGTPALRVLSYVARRATQPIFRCTYPDRELAAIALNDATLVANLTGHYRQITARAAHQRPRTISLSPFESAVLD